MDGFSHGNYWIDIVESYRKASAVSERIEHTHSAFILAVLSRIAQEAPENFLAYDKQKGVINMLLSCLATISKSFTHQKTEFLPVACRASEAIWSLMTVQSLDRLNVEEEECKQIVDVVAKALLSDKAVRYAFYICLREGSEDTKISTIRVIFFFNVFLAINIFQCICTSL
uniref:uncharacterized protein LOC122608813 n=1 Tax=Erigeron canadensis TaxID=72917 RepID=UPI001CB89054|nr:uncharacterized protein LOC122608813 [Erigeron canadensis]